METKFVILTNLELEALIIRVAQTLDRGQPATPSSVTVMKVKEVAKKIRRSEKTVRKYIRTGVLKAVNSNAGTPLRASYTVLDSDVNAYLKQKRA